MVEQTSPGLTPVNFLKCPHLDKSAVMMLLLVHFRVSTLKLMFPQPFLVMIAVLYLLDDCYVKCRIH